MTTASTTRARRRRERLEARVTPEQKQLFQRAASLAGRTLSDFLIDSARRAAEEAIRNHEVITLSEPGSQALFEMLLNPGEPSTRLQEALEHHQSVFGHQ
jgi:uncharacterized protein (DUF1778 family)